MATYDFDGMFGDRYSTEQAINSAMFNEAMSFGQLDRSKYAPMTASSYGQAYMGSAGIAGLLGGQHPMRKRQNLLDEIQKKFPDPRTPKELNELAEELSKNGFGDLAMQVRQVAMEMSKNEATKAYNVGQLKKPSSDQLKMIPRKLNAILGNAGTENAYLTAAGAKEGKNYRFYVEGEWGNHKESWLKERERHLEDMKTLVQEYADHKQGVSGWNLDNITTAIGDDNALRLDFIDYIKKHTNRTHTNMLLDAMGVPIEDTSGATDTSDTTTTQTETGSEANLGAGQAVEVNDTNFPITSKWTDKTAKYQLKRLDGLIKEGKELQPNDKKMYEELKRRFPVQLTRVDDWFLDPNMGYQPPVDVLPTQGYGIG